MGILLLALCPPLVLTSYDPSPCHLLGRGALNTKYEPEVCLTSRDLRGIVLDAGLRGGVGLWGPKNFRGFLPKTEENFAFGTSTVNENSTDNENGWTKRPYFGGIQLTLGGGGRLSGILGPIARQG